MANEKYHTLCIKAVTGEITPAEQTQLEEWLDSSVENRHYYESIVATWSKTEIASFPEDLPVDEQWEQLSGELDLEKDSPRKRREKWSVPDIPETVREIFQPRFRPAFAAMATVVIILIVSLLNRPQYQPSVREQIITANGEKTSYTFSDGSSVRINSGSSIQFLSGFSDNLREVHLKGEGFFRVAKENRPFVVITENARTTVLGTEFNVWSRHGETRVIVKSGNVLFSSFKNDDMSVRLAKNQMSCLDEKAAPSAPQKVDADHLLGWLKGRLVFERAPMMEIIDELERTFSISVVTDNLDVDEQTVTANFETTSLETVCASLCLTLGIQYKIDGNQVVLYKKM